MPGIVAAIGLARIPRGAALRLVQAGTFAFVLFNVAHDAGGHKQRMNDLFDAQLARARRREENELADEYAGSCTRTPACKVPLVQFINPLDAMYAGRRVQADILA